MSAPKRYRLGDLQLEIMKVLWERGEASVADVAAALDGATLAYTTIATMLRKMEARGLVRHTSEGRRFLYRAAVTPDAVYAGTSEGLYAGRREPATPIPVEMGRVEYRGGAIRALAATDTLLLVASASGLEVFDRRAGAWTSGERDATGTLALAVDAEGNVWIGTANGLARWRPATDEWDEWTAEDGLAGAPVLHVLAEDGVVWASTPSGVSRFAWREGRR